MLRTDHGLADRCAANGLCYAREHFSFHQMMESKLWINAELSALLKASMPVGSGSAGRAGCSCGGRRVTQVTTD